MVMITDHRDVSVFVVIKEQYDGEHYYTSPVAAFMTEEGAAAEVARLTRPYEWTSYSYEEVSLR